MSIYWKKFCIYFSYGFFIWHATALVVAPYPDSRIKDSINPIFSAYLKVLYIDSSWTFFGPNPGRGRLVRYKLLTGEGESEEYKLTETLQRTNPAFFRFARIYDKVRPGYSHYSESYARFLCHRHHNKKPTSVQFFVYKQRSLSPEYFLEGHSPLDLDNLEKEIYPVIDCPRKLESKE